MFLWSEADGREIEVIRVSDLMNQRITLIKAVRMLTGATLIDAKNVVDRFFADIADLPFDTDTLFRRITTIAGQTTQNSDERIDEILILVNRYLAQNTPEV